MRCKFMRFNLFKKPTSEIKFSSSELESAKYLESLQKNAMRLSAIDYMAKDIFKGVAEKNFAAAIKKTLNIKNITYSNKYPDIIWEEDLKSASICVTVHDYKGKDSIVIISVLNANDLEGDVNDLQLVIYFDKKDNDDEDKDADIRIALDECPANVKNADFIYNNAAEKLKQVL